MLKAKDGGKSDRMATTGFWPIKGSLKDALNYAQNPDKTTDRKYLDDELYHVLRYADNDAKTDQKMYVSAINCPKQIAYAAMMDTKRHFGKLGGNVAYHAFQSFRQGEVSPEEAHRIGKETARRMWGAEYEIVVTTHLNTDNIHNHIVLNSVSFRTGRKFENHVSDHYRLREISDAVCREHGKSVLENAKFYSGEKGGYWIRNKGGMTHRDVLRRDVDTAIANTTTYHSFTQYLRNLGYEFNRNAYGNNPSLIAKGWKRPVRLKSLGPQYTPEAIHDRLLANHSNPALYRIHYPARIRTPMGRWEQEYRQLLRMNSLQLLFSIFVGLLKLCTGSNLAENDNLPLSPFLREEVRKLDQYIEDHQFLCECHIDTTEELSAFREGAAKQITNLETQRELIRNKIRRAPAAEKAQLKEQAKAVTSQISPLRKQLKIADHILARSDHMQQLLNQERQLETNEPMKERNFER